MRVAIDTSGGGLESKHGSHAISIGNHEGVGYHPADSNISNPAPGSPTSLPLTCTHLSADGQSTEKAHPVSAMCWYCTISTTTGICPARGDYPAATPHPPLTLFLRSIQNCKLYAAQLRSWRGHLELFSGKALRHLLAAREDCIGLAVRPFLLGAVRLVRCAQITAGCYCLVETIVLSGKARALSTRIPTWIS